MAKSSGIGSWPASRSFFPGRRWELCSQQATLMVLPAALEWNFVELALDRTRGFLLFSLPSVKQLTMTQLLPSCVDAWSSQSSTVYQMTGSKC